MPRIIFTVTNDLSYDQRMQRIAGTMAVNGYDVVLVGRRLKNSIGPAARPFRQERLACIFNTGFLFYLEYNLRLLAFLLYTGADIICAVDLDTILPVYFASVLKKKARVYDAHELFTEQKEIISRPLIHKCWLLIERFAVPKFKTGYTVNDFIAAEFGRRYGVHYQVVRNLPRLSNTMIPPAAPGERFLLYQGAVNEGRCFEYLIPAMEGVHAKLVVIGTGNFLTQAQALVRKHALEHKITFRGSLLPEQLNRLTPEAYLGITLFESTGLNQYHSLANRFFDYIMAGIPQLCMNYPEYAAVNNRFQVAYLINDTDPATITAALNNLLDDTVLYQQLRLNCLRARTLLNWEQEEPVLLDIYKNS